MAGAPLDLSAANRSREDDAVQRKLLVRQLVAAGYSLAESGNGEDGLRTIYDKRPRIVICDLMLPDMSGFDVLQAMQSQESVKDALLVILSARGERDLRLLKRAVDPSAVDFVLSKPITQESLDMLLSQLHGSRRRA